MSNPRSSSPPLNSKRLSVTTYGKRARTQSQQVKPTLLSRQREPSTSPLSSPPPPPDVIELREQVGMRGETILTSSREYTRSGTPEMNSIVSSLSSTRRGVKTKREPNPRLVPDLKRTRSTAKLIDHPIPLDSTEPTSPKKLKPNPIQLVSEPIDIQPRPLLSSVHSFRPIAITDDIPLSTPPEVEGAAAIRARQAAHTPRTPPRDVTDLFLRKPSPSPAGKVRGGSFDGGGFGLFGGSTLDKGVKGVEKTGPLGSQPATQGLNLRKGRRQMMTRTESLGEKDTLFKGKEQTPERDSRDTYFTSFLASPERATQGGSTQTSPRTPKRTGQAPLTPSPSKRALGQTRSLPDSPSRPGLRQSLSTSAAMAGITSLAGGSVPNASQTRTVRTYGKAQKGEQEGHLIPAPSNRPVKRTFGRSLKGDQDRSNFPEDEGDDGSGPMDLEQQVRGFLLSSPDNLLRPLGGRSVPVQRDSYAELNKRFGVDVEDEEENTQDTQGSLGDLKVPPSLADLRSKGENRRFMDELGYLREGLCDEGISVKRSSAIDLLNKCVDPVWFGKLKICGQIEILYEDFARARIGETDDALDLVLLLYLAYLSRQVNDFESIISAHAEAVYGFLIKLARERRLSFKVGSAGRRKKSPAMDTLREVRNRMASFGLTAKERSALGMTCGLLALLLPSVMEDEGGMPDYVSPEDLTATLASTVQQELSGLSNRIDLYTKGVDLFTDQNRPDFLAVLDSLRLLQTLSAEIPECKSTLEESYATVSPLLADLILILTQDLELQPLTTVQANEIVNLSLKLFLSISQQSPAWSAAFLSSTSPYLGIMRVMMGHGRIAHNSQRGVSPGLSDITEKDEDATENLPEIELVNLALGCLFNIVQEAPDHGQPLVNLAIGDPCRSGRSCIMQCQCPVRKTALTYLVELFMQQTTDTLEHPSAAFLSGYLALLFARMMEGNTDTAKVVLEILPGDAVKEKLKLLIASTLTIQETMKKFQLEMTKGLQESLVPLGGSEIQLVVDESSTLPLLEMTKKALDIFDDLK